MRLPRLRFTIRRMCLGLALLAVLLAWGPELARRSRLRFDFYDDRVVHETLANPTEFSGLEENRVVLPGGRYLEVEAMTWRDSEHPAAPWEPVDLKPLSERLYDEMRLVGDANVIELQPAPDGRTLLYVRKRSWFCGTRPWPPPIHIRIPLFRRYVYVSRRILIGVGTIREHTHPCSDRNAQWPASIASPPS